jgi:putative inorganic carbon (HCO3(-)) transporter
MANLLGLSRLPYLCTLQNLDKPFEKTLEGSAVLAPLINFSKSLAAKLGVSPISLGGKLGGYLQGASFLFLLLLFACLGLPQFANDKEGLALVSLASLILYSLGWLLGGRGRPVRANDALVLGYFAANVVAAFASHYLPESIKGLSKIAIYILSYFLFTASLHGSRKRLVAVLGAALLTGLLVSLYGLYQFKIGVEPLATWEDPTVESKGTRIFSTLGNPNLLAGYLIPMVPLAFSLGAACLFLKSRLKWLPALAATGIGAILAVATVLTGSRGGYLALGAMAGAVLVAGIACLYMQKPKLVWLSFIVLLLVLAGTVLAIHSFAPGLEQRMLSIFAGSEHSSNAYRMKVWESSLSMFKDNWWFGVGPGNTAFRLAYGLYMTSGFDALGTYCVPLEVGVECGVLGLFFFLALLVSALASAHCLFWRQGDGLGRILALGLAAALVGLMVQGMVDTVFYRPQVHFIFWLVIAALVELRSYPPDMALSPQQAGAG